MKKIKFLMINYKYLIFCCVFLCINMLFSLNIFFLSDTINLTIKNLIILIIYLILQICLCILIYLFYKNKKYSIEKVFLILAIIIGAIYLLVIPVGRVPDEPSHFLRAYEISEGHMVSEKDANKSSGRVLSKHLYEVVDPLDNMNYCNLFSKIDQKVDNNTEFITFPGSSLYSPISYLPQSIGIFISKIFTRSILIQVYAGRIFNFITWLIIMYFALKFIPCFKRFFMVCAFLPMVMQEAISLSPDGLTMSISFLLLAYVLNLRYCKISKISSKQKLFLLAITTILSLCKIVYLPLCLLIFLIPENKFNNKKDKYITIGLMALWVIIINIIWLMIASQYLIEFTSGVNSKDQVIYILSNPIKYILVMFNTFSSNIMDYATQMAGKSLEWFSVNLSYFYPIISLGLLAYLAYQDQTKEVKIDKVTKILSLLILIVCVILIFTSLYVQWTKVGNIIIEGIQGRYFIPLLMLIPVILYNNKRKINQSDTNCYLTLYLIFFNAYAIFNLFYVHIC